MGRGRGGYTGKQVTYRDSGGHKVKDPGSIFVGERYIDMGYEVVFRREHLMAEARRKGFVKGPIEIWFSNKTKIEFPWKE